MKERPNEPGAADMPRFFRGERLLPYASLIDNPMPVFVNRVQESFELRMHAHDFIEICLVAEGAGVHYIDTAQLPVARGDLFFIPVGIAHVFRPAAKGRPLALYNCILTAEQLGKLLQAVQAEEEITAFYRELGNGQAWFHLHDRGEAARQLFQRLHLEFTARRAGFAAALSALTVELLILLYRQRTEQPPLRHAASDEPVSSSMQELLAYIRANCAAELHAADMAARLGIGERQFQRTFKRATGVTFLGYVQSARIDLSCRLLLETKDAVGHIAVRSGYQDTKFFNRLFKRKTGVTPSEYRASLHSRQSIDN
ncbi:AraC family transcriptional regulator [Paenibacillus glycinis]|uniref:Helix-turn-helix domain-containing protein n=1 Tax=Paenibacillus glycinis TaxID=2697035 RepID=A0ABW9XXW9_9BACL|nr:AraC family transcriptional regulator [Paenibacillus glycinis]NBD27534.1 helix-turn-helix domain-containing protein [Paenibacillus glycinis]